MGPKKKPQKVIREEIALLLRAETPFKKITEVTGASERTIWSDLSTNYTFCELQFWVSIASIRPLNELQALTSISFGMASHSLTMAAFKESTVLWGVLHTLGFR